MQDNGAEIDHRYGFARLATDKAKLCPVDPEAPNPLPRVGVVIASGECILGWAAKGVGGEIFSNGEARSFGNTPHAHAEQMLLDQLQPLNLMGATAYITLELCTKRRRGKSCADLLVAGISAIYIGNCDPNPDVGALAWERFHRAKIRVCDFPPELRNEARRDNAAFFRKFRWSHKQAGSASFDYGANGGKRTLGQPGAAFETTWSAPGEAGDA